MNSTILWTHTTRSEACYRTDAIHSTDWLAGEMVFCRTKRNRAGYKRLLLYFTVLIYLTVAKDSKIQLIIDSQTQVLRQKDWLCIHIQILLVYFINSEDLNFRLTLCPNGGVLDKTNMLPHDVLLKAWSQFSFIKKTLLNEVNRHLHNVL